MKPKKSQASKTGQRARRDKIVVSATRLFLKDGVNETEIKQIASLAGVNQSLISYHFDSKDELFAEVVQQMIIEFNGYVLSAVSEAQNDIEKMFETYVKRFFEWAAQNRDRCALMFYFFSLAMKRDPFMRINEQFRRAARERLASFVHRGSAEGKFRPTREGEGELIARQIQGAILGGLLVCMTERELDPILHGNEVWTWIRAHLLTPLRR